MEPSREPPSIETPGAQSPPSADVETAGGLAAVVMVVVAAVGFFGAMVMALFSGATVSNPAHDRARLSIAVSAGIVLALGGVIVGVARSRRDAGGIGRTARRLGHPRG